MFLSALTESQIIAYISTFGILLVLYLWNGIASFLPSAALSCMFGLIVIISLVILYIYQMTSNWLLSVALEVVNIIANVVVYLVKSSLFENLLTRLLGKLALADVFTGITENNILDVSGIVLYLSIIAVFVYLTVQAIQKRRWS